MDIGSSPNCDILFHLIIEFSTQGKLHFHLTSTFSFPTSVPAYNHVETGMNQHLWMISLGYHRICISCWNWHHSPYWFLFHGQFECTLFLSQSPEALIKASAVRILVSQTLAIVQVSVEPGHNQRLTVQLPRLGRILLTCSGGRVCENKPIQGFYDSEQHSSESSASVSSARISNLLLKLGLLY